MQNGNGEDKGLGKDHSRDLELFHTNFQSKRIMNLILRISSKILIQGMAFMIMLFIGAQGFGQAYPNPYQTVENWAKLPDGRTMGAVGKVTIDPDGEHIWAVIRCDATEPDRFGNECLDSDLDPILKFDQQGNVVESFGAGLFIWPHGISMEVSLGQESYRSM